MASQKDRMHVLQLAGEFPPDRIGGIATYLENVVRAAPDDLALGIVVARGERYANDPAASDVKVRVDQIDLTRALELAAKRHVLRQATLLRCLEPTTLMRDRWDVAHVHDWYGVLPGLLLATRGIPLVVTAHLPLRRGFSYANHPLPTLQKSRLESLGFRLASRVLAPSRSVRDVLVAEYDLDQSRVHVVENGVAPAEFCAAAASKRDQPTLLVASRLTEQKGIDHALSAFALVQRDLPSACMIIAGDGPQSSWLAAEVRRLKLRNVTLSGWVPHHEMSALYASAWVFLAPSAYEPFGLTVLEAMSAGTAVVASPFGGAPDFVRDGENGHLRIPHRSEELARTLVSLLTDPARRAQLGAAGRATAEAHSWEHTLTQLMSHYRAVATGGRP